MKGCKKLSFFYIVGGLNTIRAEFIFYESYD